jgi:catechol 2,3-dioxygenase-like lactoylglutathione lyase family enzyme
MIVSRLAHVSLDVPDLDAAVAFYGDLLGLAPCGEADGVTYLASGRSTTYEVCLREGPGELDHFAFAVRGERELERAWEALRETDADVAEVDCAAEPGLSKGLEFSLPSRHAVRLVLERDPQGWVLPSAAPLVHHRGIGPIPIEHVTLMTNRIKDNAEFLVETLDFRITDSVQPPDGAPWGGTWLRAGERHHDVAFLPTDSDQPMVNHIAFAVPAVTDLVRLSDGLAFEGIRLDASIGRHVAGNNIFLYFRDPFGIRLEVNTDMAQIDPAAPPRLLEQPLAFDAWRPGRPPTMEGGAPCRSREVSG